MSDYDKKSKLYTYDEVLAYMSDAYEEGRKYGIDQALNILNQKFPLDKIKDQLKK